ncbi:MAG: hypothetical protein ACRDGI_01535 [Candidatus Limnocylindrales bacterium]
MQLIGAVAIVLALIIGSIAGSMRRSAPPPHHPLRVVLAVRIVAIVVITVLVVVVAVVSAGPIGAIVVATICVALFAYWASVNGYARLRS